MSDDKRLGTNPLDWVAPEPAAIPDPKIPGTQQRSSAGPANAMLSGFYKPAETITKEDEMGKGKIKVKQTMETAQVVTYLKDLAQSLESGIIRAENEEESIVLGVAESIQVEMKLARKKGKAKCEIELEWYDDGTKGETLTIKGED